MSRTLFLILITVLLGPLRTGIVQADTNSDDLKKRMALRLKAVDALKASGKVGENNLGFLTERQKLEEKESALVKAENADRLAVYKLIAEKTGESPTVVGRKRAEDLRKSSKAGVWLQDVKGKWYKKV